MATHPVDEWFGEKIREAVRLSRIGSNLLLPLSVIVGLLSWCLLWFVIWMAVAMFWGWYFWTAGVVSAVAFYGLFKWQFRAGRGFIDEEQISGTRLSQSEWSMIRSSGSGWGTLLFDPDAGMFSRMIGLLFLMSPRMLALSQLLKLRLRRLEQANVAAAAKVVRQMLKKQAKVKLEDIAKKLPDQDLSRLIQTLTDVDGIVFLSKKEPGLTLAPRFLEEYEQWLAGRDEPIADDEDNADEA